MEKGSTLDQERINVCKQICKYNAESYTSFNHSIKLYYHYINNTILHTHTHTYIYVYTGMYKIILTKISTINITTCVLLL